MGSCVHLRIFIISSPTHTHTHTHTESRKTYRCVISTHSLETNKKKDVWKTTGFQQGQVELSNNASSSSGQKATKKRTYSQAVTQEEEEEEADRDDFIPL